MSLPPIPPGFQIDASSPRRQRDPYASYKSLAYDELEAKLEAEYRLPSGLMTGIRTRGERSNANQVSSAGAQSVYQVIPSTRAAFLKKYGVDAYAGPEQAARVAALHLRESLDRGGDPVREYIGGTDRRNWGRQTEAYAGRVGAPTAPPIPVGFEIVDGPDAAPKPAPAKPSTFGGLIGTADAATNSSLPVGSSIRGMFGRGGKANHDGDTFKLPDGRNARLSGLDAWELNQTGRKPDGSLVPLGQNARTSLADLLNGNPSVSFTGAQTYGRPVVSLSRDGEDQGAGLIRSGDALAAPDYLKGDPRFGSYMEAERLARQNLLGGHGTNAETPGQYRHKDGPWAGLEPGKFGEGGTAVFADERTPFQGLRNEVEQGYLAVAMKPGTTADDLLTYAKTNGFQIRKEDAERFIKLRDQPGAKVTQKVFYEEAPKPVTNPGDGALGSFARGFADPINMLDELGGIADTLGGTKGRESLWNSERRFGDILWNNIDQNRGILAYDDDKHPLARIGGQLTSGVLLPIGGGATTPWQLARVGAVEGGLAGFGAGEGNPFQRLPNAAGGTVLGAAGGYALGRVANDIGRGFNAVARTRTEGGFGNPAIPREVGFEAAPIVNSGAQNVGPTPAARSQPAGGAFAPQVTAWHGSPHTFEKFSTDRIGTGEGAQAFGHGLYFSERKGVAEWYRDTLSKEYSPAGDAERAWLDQAGGDWGRAAAAYEDYATQTGFLDQGLLARLKAGPKGSLHEVTIPHSDTFLDWDGALSASASKAFGDLGVSADGLIGQAAYRALSKKLGSDKAASEQLLERGVPGIRYLDGSSRDAGEGTRNFVVFSSDGVRSAAMRANDASPTLVGPAADDLPPLPPGFELEAAPFGVTRPMGSRLSAEEIARLGESVDPQGAVPRPANWVETSEEAASIGASRYPLLKAPDERSYLEPRQVQSATGGLINMRGPLDVTARLRTYGGLKDTGGDLRFVGAANKGRRGLDFGGNEQFLGRLVNNETGISLDEAAVRLTEDGYFHKVPDTDELLSRLYSEADGSERFFAPHDLNEVHNFEGARAQREAIDAAADRGSPYFDDLSHEITLDDLDNMQAPLSAYEDTPRLTGKIGNINLDRLENPGDVSQLINQVSQRVGGFDPAKRGVITQEETRKLATEMGLKPEQLLRRGEGQALNAEQLYATRVLAQKSRELVANLAKKAVGGNDEDVLAFRKAWVRHVAIEEQVAGATAEAGRALQQFRMLARAGDARSDAVKAYLKGAGGRENIEQAAQSIVDLMEDPAKASHFMREGLKPKWRDKFNELWVNSLLSGPKTHVVNFVGNALTTLYSLPEQALTAGIGRVMGSADRSFGGEVGARITGLANSAVEGLRNAKTAFKTGEPLDAVSKVEANNFRAISGLKGEVIRLPTRALTAADEFWKTINRNAELHALAYRKAVREGGSRDVRKARYEELMRSPDEGMVKAADNAARYYTFQKELGDGGQLLQRLANKVPGLKILMPFVRTPINLLKFAGERSVFGPLMPSVRQSLQAGGRARDEALAKITLGSGLSTAAVMAAMDGNVTGAGPTDQGERMALLQSGWQPYSFRVGNRWVSYQRFDPLSTLFGAAADFAEIGRYARPGEADQFALSLAQAVAKNITNKTWLSGLSDAFDVLSDPQRYGEGYVQRMAGSFAVPAISAQVAQAVDPNMREARSILDAIRARVPVLSKGLPVRRNVWGEEVMRGDAVGPDLLSPIYGTHMDRSAVSQEVARLRVPLSMPKRKVTIAGEKIDLNAEQYDTLVQLSGKPARTYLEGYIQTPEYRQMRDADRIEAIREVMKDFRKSGLDAIKGMYPELGGNLAPGDVPPLPEGFSVEGKAPSPARRSPLQLNRPDLPPLPPGFVVDR